MHSHGLENQAIEIVAQGLNTDAPSAFEKTTWGAGDDSGPAMDLVGYGMTKACADKVGLLSFAPSSYLVSGFSPFSLDINPHFVLALLSSLMHIQIVNLECLLTSS